LLALGPRGEDFFARRCERPADLESEALVRLALLCACHFCLSLPTLVSRYFARASNCNSQNARYCSIHAAAFFMGWAASRQRCTRPSISRSSRPADSRMRTCFEMAGKETRKGSASSVTMASPCASRVRIARRVGSESAPNVAFRGADE